jgi:hypothetical protein
MIYYLDCWYAGSRGAVSYTVGSYANDYIFLTALFEKIGKDMVICSLII